MSSEPVILLNMAVGTYMGRECEQLLSSYAQRVSDAGAVPMLIPSIEKRENIAFTKAQKWCISKDLTNGLKVIIVFLLKVALLLISV